MKHNWDILKGIARGVFVDHWATEQEEEGESFPGGTNLDTVAPPTSAHARKWAREVADKITKANNTSLARLYAKVKAAGYPHDEEHFGYHLGMQTAGSGVSWSDDTPKLDHDEIEVPYREYY